AEYRYQERSVYERIGIVVQYVHKKALQAFTKIISHLLLSKYYWNNLWLNKNILNTLLPSTAD
ncbi:hypothetical protein C0J52_27147, partial [Blattella germanica]